MQQFYLPYVFDFAQLYLWNPLLWDAVIYLMIFLGVCQFAFSRVYEGKHGKTVAVGIALALTISMTVWQYYTGWYLGRAELAILPITIIFILIMFVLYRLFNDLFEFRGPCALAFAYLITTGGIEAMFNMPLLDWFNRMPLFGAFASLLPVIAIAVLIWCAVQGFNNFRRNGGPHGSRGRGGTTRTSSAPAGGSTSNNTTNVPPAGAQNLAPGNNPNGGGATNTNNNNFNVTITSPDNGAVLPAGQPITVDFTVQGGQPQYNCFLAINTPNQVVAQVAVQNDGPGVLTYQQNALRPGNDYVILVVVIDESGEQRADQRQIVIGPPAGAENPTLDVHLYGDPQAHATPPVAPGTAVRIQFIPSGGSGDYAAFQQTAPGATQNLALDGDNTITIPAPNTRTEYHFTVTDSAGNESEDAIFVIEIDPNAAAQGANGGNTRTIRGRCVFENGDAVPAGINATYLQIDADTRIPATGVEYDDAYTILVFADVPSHAGMQIFAAHQDAAIGQGQSLEISEGDADLEVEVVWNNFTGGNTDNGVIRGVGLAVGGVQFGPDNVSFILQDWDTGDLIPITQTQFTYVSPERYEFTFANVPITRRIRIIGLIDDQERGVQTNPDNNPIYLATETNQEYLTAEVTFAAQAQGGGGNSGGGNDGGSNGANGGGNNDDGSGGNNNDNGGGGNGGEFNVAINRPRNVPGRSRVIPVGTDVTFTATLTGGNSAAYSSQWSVNGTSYGEAQTGDAPQAVLNGLEEGEYQVVIYSTDGETPESDSFTFRVVGPDSDESPNYFFLKPSIGRVSQETVTTPRGNDRNGDPQADITRSMWVSVVKDSQLRDKAIKVDVLSNGGRSRYLRLGVNVVAEVPETAPPFRTTAAGDVRRRSLTPQELRDMNFSLIAQVPNEPESRNVIGRAFTRMRNTGRRIRATEEQVAAGLANAQGYLTTPDGDLVYRRVRNVGANKQTSGFWFEPLPLTKKDVPQLVQLIVGDSRSMWDQLQLPPGSILNFYFNGNLVQGRKPPSERKRREENARWTVGRDIALVRVQHTGEQVQEQQQVQET